MCIFMWSIDRSHLFVSHLFVSHSRGCRHSSMTVCALIVCASQKARLTLWVIVTIFTNDLNHTPDPAEILWMDGIWHILSVLSHGWLCDRNGVRPVKKSQKQSPKVLPWKTFHEPRQTWNVMSRKIYSKMTCDVLLNPKLCMVVELVVPILKGANHFSIQFIVFSARGQNADFWPVSKFNTGRCSLCGILPVYQERPAWVLKIVKKKLWAEGAPPWTPPGELTALSQIP